METFVRHARILVLIGLATPAVLAAQAPRPLALGQATNATLGPSDPQRGGKPYHVWYFDAGPTRSIQIDMTSDVVDAYVILQDSTGRFITADDNSGGEQNARISFDLPSPGRYQVLARSSSSAAGAYSIRVGEAAEVTEGVVGTVRRPQELTAALSQGDPKQGGKPYKAWTLEGAEGDSIVIEMRSDAFDTFVILQDAMGRKLAENDDNEDGELHSRLRFRLPRTGRYRVVATAFAADASGNFTLRLR
jgi:hypothetical protein